ncbi:hypothetical protein COT75_00065 [Candidatus Beckwithbacteria bacterium CG10_big_fil_rev_8_21_14_0_10_34_10]|uniref:Glycosyltransferase 2-like domain-containing protein n=1 Tax=Candidatus Beckwithbacteria bacterium CG10_big_fil_rev_8_21_14_0_10_34_10 TaxID=1974495 RepID=A0A2H0WCF9_9BACT|nr:MAG: hypothetical protein COT75_00065 [Candidatus Beckwithbacteria bacterium CG10_big_fil_rev_8_21_14_0_10_34_10]
MKLAIIIVNFNSYPYILDCLLSLKKADKRGVKCKIILVDNNSKDESVKAISKNFPQVDIIKNRKNLGFAKANNVAIKKALKEKFDYIFLLNPDTKVEENFLEPLIQLIKSNRKIGIVSPALKEKRNGKTIYTLGAKFNRVLGKTEHLYLKENSINSLKPQEEELVSGCAMLVKTSVFKKIGLFDEKFFLYFEDTDFCLRAFKIGFKIYSVPQSVVFHQPSTSLGEISFKKAWHIFISNAFFTIKWVKPYFWPLSFTFQLPLFIKMNFNSVVSNLNSFRKRRKKI